MAGWRFYQGLRGEWRWYALDRSGLVVNSSDQGFAELPACMLNAATAGFGGGAYQVLARAPDARLDSAPQITPATAASSQVPPYTQALSDPAPGVVLVSRSCRSIA